MGETYYEKEHVKHLTELKRRIKSCTRDELEIIAESICEVDCDILLLALHNDIKRKEINYGS